MDARTPKALAPLVLQLVADLGLAGTPMYLEVAPVAGAKMLDCFPVVAAHVDEVGGAVCYGWRIWELPWAYIEAEFHAVWRSPDGDLIDITPNQLGATRVLFVEAPDAVYEGRQVKNVRRMLGENPAVGEFIDASDAEFDFLNRGSRADEYHLRLTPAEAAELHAIRSRRADALVAMMRSLPKPERNDPCPCGSGRKYKKCCG